MAAMAHLKPLDQRHEEHKAHSSVQVTLGSNLDHPNGLRKNKKKRATPRTSNHQASSCEAQQVSAIFGKRFLLSFEMSVVFCCIVC